MLKVLHTGDWHIGSFPGPEVGGQNARFQDICRCLDFQAMYAEEHRPDLIVVSGDIFHQARVWSDRGLRESRTAIDHIRRLSNVAPTVVLRGTPNHDSEEQFEMLTTAFYGDDSVSVVTEPEVLHIHTYHGQHVDVACIPGFDRGVHRAAHPGLSREEETQVFTDELAKVVLGLKAQCEPGVTSILSTHFTVPGCNMESGQTALFAQFEPVIYQDTLKAADFDLVALGHIHRPQQLPEAGRAVFYCGSITGLNFNDEGQPRGFYMRPSRGPRKGSRGHSQRGAGADYGHHQQALRLRRTEMARNSVCKTAILFVFGGLVYFGLEVLFRGHSHWTMFVLGGFLFLILGELNEGLLEWDTPLIWQGVLGSAIVTGAELVTGMILNVWLGLGVWDYSGMPFNYKGQICLPFSILWIFVSIAAVVLDDWLRYWLFGEEHPHYTLFRRGESR